MPEGTTLTINLHAIAENYRRLQALSNAAVGASIKADAYGLGAAQVGKTLHAAGCRDFFVATPDEGVALREITDGNIFVLGGFYAGDSGAFAEYRLIPVLNAITDIRNWQEGPCAVHFDTGMNRLGLGADETREVLDNPGLIAHLDVVLGLSHFACSDEEHHPMNGIQCAAFDTLRARLKLKRWSLCNSSGIFHAPRHHADLVRPGYALYGGNPAPTRTNPMLPVVGLEASVLQIRKVRAGESVGYGAGHVFATDTTLATLCLGYADGLMRSLSHAGTVYWQGQPCPVLGRVSMDLVSVDIGHLNGPQPKPGAVFEVLGPHQGIDAIASAAGTIGYEMLTSLGGRYARVYKDTP